MLSYSIIMDITVFLIWFWDFLDSCHGSCPLLLGKVFLFFFFCSPWHMSTFRHGRCHSLAVMGLMCEPSANLPPSEPIIWLFVRSAEPATVGAWPLPAVSRCWNVNEQPLGRQPHAASDSRRVVLSHSDTQSSPTTGFCEQQQLVKSAAPLRPEESWTQEAAETAQSLHRHTRRQMCIDLCSFVLSHQLKLLKLWMKSWKWPQLCDRCSLKRYKLNTKSQ